MVSASTVAPEATRKLHWPAELPSVVFAPGVVVVGAALVGFLLSVLHGPAAFFIYDALGYWRGAVAALQGDDYYLLGGLIVRGALSTVVYAPAAVVTMVFGPGAASSAVLVQNSLLIAALGAVVIPAIVRLFVAMKPLIVYISAIATAIVFGGMAPYPLVDLWTLTLVLVAILVVARRPGSWRQLLCGGVLLGVVFNLRPAYIVPVLLIALSWGFFSRVRVLAAVGGFAVALIPQVITNIVFAGSFLPWPVKAFVVSDVQTRYAAFIVRYDTLGYVPGATSPQLFYCNPTMATNYLSGAPESVGALALSFAQHLPTSVKFVAQKVAASLQWSSVTPYSDYVTRELSALTLAVTVISAVGIVGLVWFLVRRNFADRRAVLTALAPVFALWVGCLATVAFSTPEARFAVPFIAVGLVGVLLMLLSAPRGVTLTPTALLWLGGTIALIGVLLWLGSHGLAHPAPLGDATAQICSVS